MVIFLSRFVSFVVREIFVLFDVLLEAVDFLTEPSPAIVVVLGDCVTLVALGLDLPLTEDLTESLVLRERNVDDPCLLNGLCLKLLL